LKTIRQKSTTAIDSKETEINDLKEQLKNLQSEVNKKQIQINSMTVQTPKTPIFKLEEKPVTPPSLRKPVVEEKGFDEQLLHFAQIQALRDEELTRARKQIQQLTQAVHDGEEMDQMHQKQEGVLKNEIRDLERAKKREGANLEYLKNIVFKYITTDEHETLLPVLATLLQFAPEEIQVSKQKIANEGLWGSTVGKIGIWNSPAKKS